MDIQRQREMFEELPLAKLAIECEYVYYNQETNSYFPNEDYCPDSAPESMNFAWQAWQQAQKVAVPEGFVLVEKSKLLQILGSAVAINTNPKTKINLSESDFIVSEVKAMIEAQEQVG